MSDDVETCIGHAQRCIERAKSALSPVVQMRFERMAHSWLRLAEDIEDTQALLEQQRLANEHGGSAVPRGHYQ
jgi:hypothetical protein